jgi:hypothetical protein
MSGVTLGRMSSIRSAAEPQDVDGVWRVAVGRVSVPREHVGDHRHWLPALGRLGRRPNGVGPERVLGRVERAGHPGAMPRVWGAAGEPAPHGLDVDLDDVGELLERQPRARDRGPEVLVLQTLSPSQKCRISRR